MSYDLMVFDPASAPMEREAFMGWFRDQTEWKDEIDYNNPENCTDTLRAWLFEMMKKYPAMNGPFAPEYDGGDTTWITGYSIGPKSIYIDFRWSAADSAFRDTFACAKKHGVGFFDVSSDDGGVWVPTSDGYVRIHGSSTGPEEAISAFQKVLNLFKKK
jgi:hypothetical protein